MATEQTSTELAANGEDVETPVAPIAPQHAALIGGTELADEQLQWLRIGNEMQELTKETGFRTRRVDKPVTDAGRIVAMQETNVVYADDGAGGKTAIPGDLKGRDKTLQKAVMARVIDIQDVAKKVGTAEYRRRIEKATVHARKPWQLLVPTHGEPASMFEPLTYAMAMPHLFVYGDLVPFLLRETPMNFLEWVQMLLAREELPSEA